MISYYIIDLETNGLLVGHHEVVEFSIIRASDRVQLSLNIRCLSPERSSLDALRITGKTLADLQVGDPKEKVVAEVNAFMDLDKQNPSARCIIGHNIIKFDKRFLHEMWSSSGSIFPADLYLDTLELTKQFIKVGDVQNAHLYKTATGRTSTTLHSALGLTGTKQATSQKHTAKSDTRNTYMLWQKLVNDHQIDYLPFIKNHPHIVKTAPSDIDTFDMADVE